MNLELAIWARLATLGSGCLRSPSTEPAGTCYQAKLLFGSGDPELRFLSLQSKRVQLSSPWVVVLLKICLLYVHVCV